MELLEIRGTDFCCFGDVKLSLKDMGLVWIGGKNKDTKAADNNGSGKSTIFKLLTWTLFGQTVDKEKGDKVIRHGAKMALGEVDLLDGKDVWTVQRTRKKGVPFVSIIQPDGIEFKAGKEEIQEKIFEMVGGLDFLAFKNTVLYGQNDIESRFSNPKTKDVERKDMLHKILRTGLLKHCHKWASEKRLEVKRKAAEKNSTIDTLRARFEEVDLGGVKELRDNYEAETLGLANEQEQLAKEHRAAAESKMAQVDLVVGPKSSIRKKLTEKAQGAHSKQLKLMSALKESEIKDDDLVEAESEVDYHKEKANNTKGDIRQLKKELERLSGSKCSVCKSSLKTGIPKRYIDKTNLKLKKALSLQKKCERKVAVAIEAFEMCKDELNTKRQFEKELAAVKLELSEANGKLSEWDIQFHEVKTKKKLLKAKAKELGKQAESAEKRALGFSNRKNPFKKMVKEAKKKRKTYGKLIKEQMNNVVELELDLAHLEFWVKGFSNQGLPSFVMDGVMPFITERANHYLETLSDGDITMEFNTQREMKSKKEFRDEIDISWTIEGIDGSYPPSGGQMKKMEIATDFALMDLVAAREGGGVDLLALDEVLDGLDEEGRQRVVTLLREIRAKRGTVFVISHDPDVSEVFEKAVIVKKEDGKSSLEVIS